LWSKHKLFIHILIWIIYISTKFSQLFFTIIFFRICLCKVTHKYLHVFVKYLKSLRWELVNIIVIDKFDENIYIQNIDIWHRYINILNYSSFTGNKSWHKWWIRESQGSIFKHYLIKKNVQLDPQLKNKFSHNNTCSNLIRSYEYCMD